MTTNEAVTLTVKQYATLLGVSLSTAYRKMHARKVWNLAERRDGRYVVLLSQAEVRAWKAALVDRDQRAGAQIKSSPWGADLSAPRALRQSARDSLVALGASDVIVALDAVRILPSSANRNYLDNLIAS